MAAAIVLDRNRSILAAIALCFVHLSVLLKLVAGREFMVGGKGGWVLGNYTAWALRHKFYEGDSLLFNYPQEPNAVVEVNHQHFDACNATDPIATFGDGKTMIQLNSTGPMWFISGVANNCNQGQKFGIIVFSRSSVNGGLPESAPAPAPVRSAPAPANAASSLAFGSVAPLLLALFAFFLY